MTKHRSSPILILSVLAALSLSAGAALAQDDTQAKIDSALSAGPPSVTANATILDNALDDAGQFVVLREGTNGWYCFPDSPGTTGLDPVCADDVWLDFIYALVKGENPTVTKVGISYMLQGGSEASVTDPSLTEPPEGEDWIATPPHLMLLFPGDWDTSSFSTDHTAPGPWLMWAGTPYQHVMVPVEDLEMSGMSG